MAKNAMFEKKVRDNIVAPYQRTQTNSGYGIILHYDQKHNTATVMMSAPDSDDLQEIIYSVPCPVQMGVQGAAPEEGRMCQVVFKNGNAQYPVITNFYNYHYSAVDYTKQTKARQPLPHFMLTM